MATVAPPKVFVLKDVELTFGNDDYRAHVSQVEFTPSQQTVQWRGLSPSATVTDLSQATWTVTLTVAQDWSSNGLSRYLFNNAGQSREVTFRPTKGDKTVFEATVILMPGAIGGTIDAVATQQVTLPVRGRPVLLDATAARYAFPTGENITNFQPGHGWETIGSGHALFDPNNTEQYMIGSQSLKVVSGNNARIVRYGLPPFDLTHKALRFRMKLHNYQALSNIIVRVGTNNLAHAFRFRANPRNTNTQVIGLEDEWFTFTLSFADVYDAQSSGVYSLVNGLPNITTGFTDIEIAIGHSGPTPVTAWVQSVDIVPTAKAAYPNGIVTIGWDDGWGSAWEGFQLMDSFGMVGTHYLIADNVDTSGRLTMAQYKTMEAAGWEIAGHSYTQAAHDARWTSLTAEEVHTEARLLKEFLEENNFNGTSFAYPGGEFGFTTDGVPVGDIVAEYFTNGRSILFSTGVLGHFVTDVLPPAMPWRIRAITGISESKNASAADNPTYMTSLGGVLDKVAEHGAYLNLLFHQTVPGLTSTDGLSIGLTALEQILQGIEDRGMAVKTAKDVLAPYLI